MGQNQGTLDGRDVVKFLGAAQYVKDPRPDRDLILGLSQHLLVGDEGESLLDQLSSNEVADLLVSLAANGQPPGTLLAATALRIIASAVGSSRMDMELLVAALEAVALSAGTLPSYSCKMYYY